MVVGAAIRIGFSHAALTRDEAEIAADRQKVEAAIKFQASIVPSQDNRDQVTQAENESAEATTTYNNAVQKYNTDIELFPNSVAAALFGFHRKNAYVNGG